MIQLTRIALLCVALGCHAAQTGPTVEAPKETESNPALLAVRAAEAYREMNAYRPDVLEHLFDRPAAAVVEDLEGRRKRINAYHKALIELYGSMSRDIERDLNSLRQSSKTDWIKYREQRTQAALRSVGAMRTQETRLEEQIRGLADRNDTETRQYRGRLEAELQSLRTARQGLTDSIADMAVVANNPSEGQKAAADLADAQLGHVKRLLDLESRIGRNLDETYENAVNAVKKKAGVDGAAPRLAVIEGSLPGPPSTTQAPVYRSMDGGTAAPSGVAGPAEIRRPAGPVTWRHETVGPGPSYKFQFEVEDWSRLQLTGTLHVERDSMQLSVLGSICEVGAQQLSCHSTQSGSPLNFQTPLIKESPPETLVLTLPSELATMYGSATVAMKLVTAP